MTTTDQSSSSQRKLATVLLIKEILNQVDEVADLRKRGLSAKLSQAMLAEMCTVLRELDPETQATYFEHLITLAAHSECENRTQYSEEFAHLSVRSKKKFIASIREKLVAHGE